MSRLTVQQAEREAKWRWGGLLSKGVARFVQNERLPFEVGTSFLGSVRIRGKGSSWEGAFQNAATQTNAKTGGT